MLFHVTLTHTQADCPGRRAQETPELASPVDRLEALGTELSVTTHSLVWGAACILWAEPEHVAFALLEAPSLEAVERYIGALTPAAWSSRTLPVFTLPGQLEAVRQLLALPAMPVVPPPAVAAEPAEDVDDADTLKGLTASSTEHEAADVPTLPPEEPPDKQVTRAIPQPVFAPPVEEQTLVPEPVAPPGRESSAVTRFIERPAILEGLPSSTQRPEQPATPPASVVASEPASPSESTTVILEPKAQPVVGMRLVANTGPAQGSVFDVGEAGATLGRLPDNSICLTDGRLSRHHARIEFRADGYWLSDLGSQNGTLVNDHALSEAHRLQAGDSIELGTTRLTVMLDAAD